MVYQSFRMLRRTRIEVFAYDTLEIVTIRRQANYGLTRIGAEEGTDLHIPVHLYLLLVLLR